MHYKGIQKMNDRLKRAVTGTRSYKKGSMTEINKDMSKNYDAINLKNDAVKNWNNLSKKSSSKKRQAGSPFSRIAGLRGFGSIPQLGYKSAYKRKK